MTMAFSICALIGGTVLVIQLGMAILGFGGAEGADAGDPGDLGGIDVHHGGDPALADAHHHAMLPGIVKLITFQTVVAFLAFFGVAGMASQTAGQSGAVSLAVAVIVGFCAMAILGYLLQGFRKLEASGTLQMQKAVGCHGRVYLKVPAESEGEGKVTITVQGRSVELKARTSGPELATGVEIIVSKLLDPQTVEVAAIETQHEKHVHANA